MKSLLRVLILMFILCVSAGVAATRAADAPNVPSNDYLNALQAADSFASAWAHRDSAGGAKTVTGAVRAKAGASALAIYFSGTSSPQHWAYEIGTGKLVRSGRYQFPVRFYSYLSAGGGFVQSTGAVQLTVEKATAGSWLVAALPPL